MSDLVKRLRIKAGMIEMGEMIAWGSDSALMREAADVLELSAPAVQGEPVASPTAGMNLGQRIRHVGGCETERGIVRFGSVMAVKALVDQVLRDIATTPQSAPDVAGLMEALEQVIKSAPSGGPLWHGSKQIVEARAALTAYRKGGDA